MMLAAQLSDEFIVGEIVTLMSESEFHSNYSASDINRLIVPAVYHDRARCYFDDETEELVGFITWTFLTPEAESGYIDGTRTLQPMDWMTAPEEGQLWIIDMVAPFGGVREMVRSTKKWFDLHYKGYCRKAFFKRGLKNNRIGYFASNVTIH